MSAPDIAPLARTQPLRDRWEQLVREDPAIGGTALAVLLVMATWGNRDGTRLQVGEKRLAANVSVSVPTVRRAIRLACQTGYLERLTRGHRLGDGNVRPSEYALRLPATSTDHPRSVEATSTDHAGLVDTASTAQTEGLNRSNEPSQPLTTDPLPVLTRNDHTAHAREVDAETGDPMDSTDQLDEALAIWSATHPGREREALAAATALMSRQGVTVSHPAGFFATWPAERRAAVKVAAPPRPPCPDCSGEGLVYEQPADPAAEVIARKCDHTRKRDVA